MTEAEYGLGRIHAPDPRDTGFPMRAALVAPTAPSRLSRYWNANGWWGDQGSAPHCVAFAWTHWLEDGPITHNEVPPPLVVPSEVYHAAQQVDEWPGEGYDGTSVRAGAKVLQAQGYIESYFWAWSIDDVAVALLERGPVVVGTNWYEGMFEPAPETHLLVPSGGVAGGHAYLLNGVNLKERVVRIKNSWGRSWGKRGHAYITFDDMDRLIKEDGEACLAVEAVTPRRP